MGIDIVKKKYAYLYCPNARNRAGRCTNKAWVDQEILIPQLEQVFKAVQMPDYMIDETERQLKLLNAEEKDDNMKSIEALRKEYDRCQKKIDGLIDMKLENTIKTEDYQRKMTEFKTRQMEINGLLKNCTTADGEFNRGLLTVLELARNSYELFKSSDVQEKRLLLNLICPNIILEGKKLSFVYRKPFSVIAEGSFNPKWLTWVDTVRTDYRDELLEFYPLIPSMEKIIVNELF